MSARQFKISIGAAALLMVAACGHAGQATTSTDNGSDSGSGGKGEAAKIRILSPAEGASVKVPFTLKFDPGVPIGPTDSGKDHVHIFVDGKTNEYTVVTKTSYQIKNLPTGKHTVGITLQHADHSPVGPKARIMVTVTNGSAKKGGSSGSGKSGSNGGGGYGY
ncbi:hypothetical protein ABZV93_08590 [Actinopolymorpha sp. NPDC004070]|uniref:hypothetical protein n=1 Tax=Actinopolymorpha sp. NPDC004070 TaxID=3154548 RepID=UPI0033B2D8F3